MTARRKVLVTGASSQVARPVALALAATDEVWCAGRFGEDPVRRELEAAGIRTATWDMAAGEAAQLPRDFTHVFHAAIIRHADPLEAMRVNAAGTARLMAHCREAAGFAFVSTAAVYRFVSAEHDHAEHDVLGGHTPLMPAYGPSKIAVEGVVHGLAASLGLKAAILRLNTSYGPHGHGGGPVRFFRMMREDQPIPISPDDWCCPIHTDDLVRFLPRIWALASTQAPTINLGGDEKVTVGEMMRLVERLTGVTARFKPTELVGNMLATDNRLRHSLLGACEVRLQDGLRRALEAHFPGATAA